MMNELKDICDRLQGYNNKGWSVTRAAKNEDGSWSIQLVEIKDEKEVENADE